MIKKHPVDLILTATRQWPSGEMEKTVNRNNSRTIDDSWGPALYSHVNAGYICSMSSVTSKTQAFVQEQILIHPRCVMCFPYNLQCPHNDDNTRSISGANILILAVHPWLKLNTFTFHRKTIAAKVDLENKDKGTEWEHRFSNLPSPSSTKFVICVLQWW